jgi:hypothetical protein
MPEIARNGASIGPQMTMDAGSLGVWVWFQPKGNSERTPCFLTCYNVIASGEGDPERRKRNDIEGIGLKEAVGPNPIKVDYPAPFDAAVTKKDFESKIEKGDDLDKANTRSLEIFNQYMSENGIGRVEYASGVRKKQDDRRMDWALVVINNPKMFGQNSLPLQVWRPEELFNARLGQPKWSENQIVSKIAPPKEGDWVAKSGRTTQARAGEVIAMKAKVTFSSHQLETSEIQVLNAMTGVPFAKDGDSGSIVVNYKGEWIGIVMAIDMHDEVTYIMSAKDIMDDIEKQTNGGTISLA